MMWLFSHSVTSDSFATPWTVSRHTPLSMEFPRQEDWSGLLVPSPGDLPDSRMEPVSPALAGGFLTTEPQSLSSSPVQQVLFNLPPAPHCIRP